MSNPFIIAKNGKGFLPMLARGGAIASRYGMNASKINGALEKLASTMRQYACEATIPVTASALAYNPSVALKYQNNGMELAVHGLHHVDYSMLSFENQLEHIHQAVQVFQQSGISVKGFRCPYLRWNTNTLAVLSSAGFTYDSSQALAWDVMEGQETDTYKHVLDFYRAQPASNFLAIPRLVNRLVRIPYSLPDDEALVERLRKSKTSDMAEIWLAMLDRTYQAGELFTLGLHPERVVACQHALQAVLEKARTINPCIWIARLDEIAEWFIALGNTTFEITAGPGDLFHVRIDAPARATILIRSMDVIIATQPWIQPYRTVASTKFTARGKKRPVIGISPISPPSLKQFLQHQGYLMEVSPDRQRYHCYLDLASFQEEDERPLIAMLEKDRSPLIRLSRWPDEARSVLSITGDVDAFTIWDYARRFLVN